MRLSGHTARIFTARNVGSASVGFASLIMPVLAVGLSPAANFGVWLFVTTPVLGLLGVILNARGLIRIREGRAGDYDLILTWPGFFVAVFTSLFSMLPLLMLATA